MFINYLESYALLIILLLIIALPITFILLFPQLDFSFWYFFRLKFRNRALKKLASEYSLNFKTNPVSPGKIFLRIFHPLQDEEFNCLEGQINNHTIQIKDIFVLADGRVTATVIDGKRSTSILGLTPIYLIKNKLDELTS